MEKMSTTEMNCKPIGLTDICLTPKDMPIKKSKKMSNNNNNNNNTELTKKLRKEKIHVWKNIIILDLAIFLYHSPMMTYTNIMSSLNSSEGQGLASESINAGILLTGSLLLCSYGTKRWTSKNVILAACILTLPYLLINFYVVWATIIPGSIMAGIGDCLITQAVCVYYSDIATYYSKTFGCEREGLLLRMFGLCGVVIQGSFILGNILVWRILDTDKLWSSTEDDADSANRTFEMETASFCGPHFCYDDVSANYTAPHPEQWRIYTLCGVFTAMGVLAVVSVFCLDDYSHLNKKTVPKFKEVIVETLHMLLHRHQLLLVVITILVGMAEGFFFGDYTQAYVSCSIGISQVGLVMICYGLANGICCLCQESLSAWLGRVPIMTFGGSLLTSLIIVLLHWQPHRSQIFVYYILAALWGLADGIISTHISTLYGTLYEDKSQDAYSCQTFWYGVGLCISFGYSYYLCVYIKLYILIAIVIAAMVCYYALEIHLYYSARARKAAASSTNQQDEEIADSPIRTVSSSVSQVELVDNYNQDC